MDSLLATDRQRRGHVIAILGLPCRIHVPAASPGRESPYAPGGSRRRACLHCPGGPPRHRIPSSPALGGACIRSPSTRTQPLTQRHNSASDARTIDACSTTTPEPSNETPHPDNPRPAAAIQAICVSSRHTAWRSEKPSKACHAITVAITSAGADGRPLPKANRSSNMSPVNNRQRCYATNP